MVPRKQLGERYIFPELAIATAKRQASRCAANFFFVGPRLCAQLGKGTTVVGLAMLTLETVGK